MKRMIRSSILLALVAAGCATQYDIVLTNGGTLIAKGKPRHDDANNVYWYKDSLGQKNYVGDFKVKLIQPSSMRSDKPKPQYLERQ